MLESDLEIQEDYDLQEDQEGSKLQKRMTNFKQHLRQKLEQMGLQIQNFQPKNRDPELEVQQQIQKMTSLLIEKTQDVIQDHLNLTELVSRNQDIILKYYAGILSIAEIMVVFSKDLYSGGEHISTFRNFKKLYDQFAQYSVMVNQFQPFSEQFQKTQQKYINKQQTLLNKIIFKDDETQPQSSRENIQNQIEQLRQQNEELKDVLRKYQQQLTKYENYDQKQFSKEFEKENLRLTTEIEKLERILSQNNQDFSIQIQRYNRLLKDEREEFKRIEMDLRNDIRILQYSVRQAQKQLVLMKQQKNRDQMMIDNLIRKNRHLQNRDNLQYTSLGRTRNNTMLIPPSPKREKLLNGLFKKITQ